jgi:hypothetical protein
MSTLVIKDQLNNGVFYCILNEVLLLTATYQRHQSLHCMGTFLITCYLNQPWWDDLQDVNTLLRCATLTQTTKQIIGIRIYHQVRYLFFNLFYDIVQLRLCTCGKELLDQSTTLLCLDIGSHITNNLIYTTYIIRPKARFFSCCW